MKILLVDDCLTTRRLLGFYLRSEGFDVTSAENGLDALQKLGTEGDSISLVLTDLNMPYMDGIELIRSIRSDPAMSHFPILMVTTEADEEEKTKALEAGANGYVVKPVTSEMVAFHIRRILKDIFDKGGMSHV